MSNNKADHVQSTLSKLDQLLGKTKKKPRVDYKELNDLKKKAFLKFEDGKNQIAIVKPTEDAEDPFFVWGYHNSLQEVAYYSVPCDRFNKNEDCVVCSVIKSLQEENYDKNKHIWYPIRQQTEIYVPVINLKSDETIAEGLKWARIGNSIVTQLTEWLRNLESTEQPFYSDFEPQKIIINYSKDEIPANKYKLVNKNMKAFSAQQLADWRGSLKSVPEYMFSKKQEDLKELVDSYFEKISQEIGIGASDANTDVNQDDVTSKLNSLKTGN